MIKSVSLTVIVLPLVLAQAYFIYALQGGASSGFESVWSRFGVPQSSYSSFVFRTIEWWWVLPGVCICLLAWALWCPQKIRITSALVVSITGTAALYWSAYAPSLFIDA